MTKEECINAGKVCEKVVYDLYPEKQYRIRAVSDVFATEKERREHYPLEKIIITLIDIESGDEKHAGNQQLTLADPAMYAMKMKALIQATSKSL